MTSYYWEPTTVWYNQETSNSTDQSPSWEVDIRYTFCFFA
jgi:hypothetical protein